MFACLKCASREIQAQFHDWKCLACGHTSKGVDMHEQNVGAISETVVEPEGLDRRTDVTGPSADQPAATPTSLITGARPAAMTTTPELENNKLATKSKVDATQIPAAPVPPDAPQPPSGQADEDKKLDPAPFAPGSGLTTSADLLSGEHNPS